MTASTTAAPAGRDRYGIALPQHPGGGPGELGRLCALAESLGFASGWVADHLRGPDPALDPFTTLAFAAAHTSTLRLGVAIAVSAARPPLELARVVASLDQVSGGRMELGLGSGAPRMGKAFGLGEDEVFPRFQELVGLVTRLWSEDRVTASSPWWELQDWPVGVRPLQRPRPPLWVGARVRSALRFAVRAADGWIGSGSSSAQDFASQLGTVRQLLEAEGRDPATFAVAKRVYLSVLDDGDSRDRAREAAREWFGGHYGVPDMADRFCVVGPPAECAEHVAALHDTGAGMVILHPLAGTREQMEAAAAVADLAG